MTETPRLVGSGSPRARSRTALACSVADQAVVALTNIAVVIVAARQSSAETFAAFAVVHTVFAVLLGVATAFVGQALVLQRGTDAELHGQCRAAALFTIAASAVLGGLLAATALLLTGDLADGLFALGLVLPLILTQDALRYGFALLGLAHRALGADVLRLSVAVPALVLQPDDSGPGRLVLAWGLSVIPALLVGGWLLVRATRGALRAPFTGPLRRGHLGYRFVVEFAVGNAGTQLAVIGLGVLGNPLAVGALRGATTLFGPMNALYNAATGFGPPLLNRLDRNGLKARAAVWASAVLAAVGVSWGLVLVVLPDAAGQQLLGDTWQAAAALLPATGAQYVVMAFGVCGLLTLRVLRPRATLPIQVVFSLLSVGLFMGGYALGGVLGAAWGLAAGSAAKSAAAWLTVRWHLRHPLPPPDAAE